MDTTDVDLPADGTLVFFAVPEIGSDEGRVVYVPAGEECTEAEPPDDFATHLLLAEFFLDRGDVGDDFGTDYTTVFYVCSREDLAARRFEAVEMVSDFLG
ncbi:hypothetical protein AB0F72_00075 [Actinoplanes sp. NPDC023936]|uniref:hypothetical protein n=1 Tax=Actinoplanes sp. NPDC023936 TaxID=3154910 RepID=UPI0033C7F61B